MLTPGLGSVCAWVVSCDGLTKTEGHLGALGQAGQKAGVSTEQFQVRVASEGRVTGTSQNGVSGRGSRVSEVRPKTAEAVSNVVCAGTLSRSVAQSLSVTLRTVAHQASLSMGFFRQEYRSGLPYPPPGDLLHLGIRFVSCVFCIAGGFFTWGTVGKAPKYCPRLIIYPIGERLFLVSPVDPSSQEPELRLVRFIV